MVSSSSSITNLAMLVSLSANVLAASRPLASFPLSIKLHGRVPPTKSANDIAAWAKAHKINVEAKYKTPSSMVKRSSGQNLIVNQDADSSFFGSIAVGTPPVTYNVILDTGSADLWLASSNCTDSACQNITSFAPSASSTFSSLSTPFNITYGNGTAAGTLGTDVVQMAGFAVSNQVFAVCDAVSDNLVQSPVSGLMGLAFQTIASSGASPFWETLVASGAWTEPLMAFQLTRYNNDSSRLTLEPGGTFTMGAVNSSLYTGDIDYNDIPAGEATYWSQTISAIISQGTSISTPSGSSALAAIDTGTTLIGGPASAIAEIYATIPNSIPGTGELEGYYTYPCSTIVEVEMSFGGQSWAISSADFQAQVLNESDSVTCLGAFYALDSVVPAWVVGDTFLKNVYSVFRYNPPSVGFAQLSTAAIVMNGINATIPSATAASVIVTVSATSTSGSQASNNAGSLLSSGPFSPLLRPLLITIMAMTHLLV